MHQPLIFAHASGPNLSAGGNLRRALDEYGLSDAWATQQVQHMRDNVLARIPGLMGADEAHLGRMGVLPWARDQAETGMALELRNPLQPGQRVRLRAFDDSSGDKRWSQVLTLWLQAMETLALRDSIARISQSRADIAVVALCHDGALLSIPRNRVAASRSVPHRNTLPSLVDKAAEYAVKGALACGFKLSVKAGSGETWGEAEAATKNKQVVKSWEDVG